jgi:hypothetical protein
MPEAVSWQLAEPALGEDGRLMEAVREAHESLLHTHFAGDPAINPALGVECRAFRRLDDWRVMLVLTPWMLARLLFPDRPPEVVIPAGWSAADRTNAGYEVLGPVMEVALLGQTQRTHLNFQPRLGHYLLHPLCLNMMPYANAEAVLEAWNQVIRTRDQNMEQMQRECAVQKDISRREFFGRIRS